MWFEDAKSQKSAEIPTNPCQAPAANAAGSRRGGRQKAWYPPRRSIEPSSLHSLQSELSFQERSHVTSPEGSVGLISAGLKVVGRVERGSERRICSSMRLLGTRRKHAILSLLQI